MGRNKVFVIVLVAAAVLLIGAVVFFSVPTTPSGQPHDAGEISNGDELVLNTPPQT